MKVATITIHKVNNYGSVLQSYATQTVFQRLGCEHEIIDYLRPGLASYRDFRNYALSHAGFWNKNTLTRIAYTVLKTPSYRRQEKVFDGFLHANVILNKQQYLSFSQLANDPPKADLYCTGSDQTWNCIYNGGFDSSYLLEFAGEKPRISFSASIGYSDLPDEEQNSFISALKKYKAISVRESSAKQVLHELGFPFVVHTLDPTMLLTKEDWSQFMGSSKVHKPYLLIYQLNPSKAFDAMAERIAQEKNLTVVRICNLYDHIIRNGKPILIPTVSEWLTLFANASAVVTDSFHGTAFSINFNRQVYVFYPPKYNTRLESIVKLFGIENHVLKEGCDPCGIDPIDFNKVNRILEQQREVTIQYLKTALAN